MAGRCLFHAAPGHARWLDPVVRWWEGGHDFVVVRPRRGGSQPSWSPGRRFVAFTRRGQVLVVRSTGGPARRLARGTDPVWSPDGKRIAFFRALRSPETLGDRATFVHVLSRRTGRTRRVSDEWMASEGGRPSATAGLDWQPLPRSP